MNQCKQCGKEIPKGKKFCNSSCAAKYNNAHRIRKPWTEEQKLAIRKKRYCKYCGKEIERGTVCDICKPFTSKIAILRKFDFTGTLQNRWICLQEYLYQLYVVEQKSLVDIYKKTGLWGQTTYPILVKMILVKMGCYIRDKNEAVHLAVLQGKVKVGIPDRYRYCYGYHTTWEGKKIFYRGSYELEYALQLDEQQISYDVEDLRIEYFDTQKNKKRIAIPDFYLPETNEIVEIKSSYTYDEQNMKDKFKAYRERGFRPKLILDKKSVSM